MASTPSLASRNTGNKEKLKQTPSTYNKLEKNWVQKQIHMGFSEINMPSKLGRKVPKVRTKPKSKGASIESHSKFITEANKKNDDYRKKGLFYFTEKLNTDF